MCCPKCPRVRCAPWFARSASLARSPPPCQVSTSCESVPAHPLEPFERPSPGTRRTSSDGFGRVKTMPGDWMRGCDRPAVDAAPSLRNGPGSHEGRCAAATPRQLRLGGFRRALVAPAQELVQGEGDFVGMRRAPGNNALELDGIVSDGADFHQLGFDGLRVSHRISSMAHVGTVDTWLGLGRHAAISAAGSVGWIAQASESHRTLIVTKFEFCPSTVRTTLASPLPRSTSGSPTLIWSRPT